MQSELNEMGRIPVFSYHCILMKEVGTLKWSFVFLKNLRTGSIWRIQEDLFSFGFENSLNGYL